MTARRLLAWADLEERRRRQARRGLGRMPAAIGSGVLGVVLAAVVYFSAQDNPADGVATASRWWIAAVLTGNAVVVFGAPYRLFWRRDAAFLSRLAIDGRALYHVALMRGVRSGLRVWVPCAAAALLFGPLASWSLALRHVALAGLGSAAAVALGSASALFAGAMVASARALQLIESMAGTEIAAPKTTWLGLFPGLAATAVGAGLLAGAPWAAGAKATAIGPMAGLAAGLAGAALVALLASLALAPAHMADAVREVSALDRERLAHIELTRPSALERAWLRWAVPAPAWGMFIKDACLARRRYPAPYFLFAMGVLGLWTVAAVRPSATVQWAAALASLLAIYAVIMARRLAIAPVEQVRLLATLAICPRHVLLAKRRACVLRVLTTFVAGTAPLAVGAANPLAWCAGIAATAAAVVVVSARLIRGELLDTF
jgi:hypothetical protein